MSGPATRNRLYELLADRAVQGLSRDEGEELTVLLDEHPSIDESELDWTAAAVDLALTETDEPLPSSLRARVEDDAIEWSARHWPDASGARDEPEDAPAMSIGPGWRLAPWLLAAACILLAVIAWLPARAVDLATQRDELIARDGTNILPWVDAAGGGASGDVVWNGATQTGFMRLRGLQANDRGDYQYQLWIFDAERAGQGGGNAVDGGVFDIDPSTGDVIVAIDPKLRVFEPSLFAVTTEPPGGVVKHDPELDPERFKIILTAPVDE